MTLPSPLIRSRMTVAGWLYWRMTKQAEDAQRRELGLPKATGPSPRRIMERGSLEIQAYDELCFPGLAAEWGGRRPFVGALTMELTTDADDEVASWIAAGTPPIYFGFGSMPVESAADTVAMISAACAQLGERALICSGASDFSRHPTFRPRQGCGRGQPRGHLSRLPRGRPPWWRGHHRRKHASRSPHVDSLDRGRSADLGSSGQKAQSRLRPALLEHHPGIAGRGPPHHPRAAVRHPSPRDRDPDDQTRRKRHGRSRSAGRRGPRQSVLPLSIAVDNWLWSYASNRTEMTAVHAVVKLIRRSTLKRKPPVRAGNAQAPWPLEPWQSGSETRVNCLETAFVSPAEFATTIALRSRKYAAKPVDAVRIALPPLWFDVFHSVPHFLRVYRLSVG